MQRLLTGFATGGLLLSMTAVAQEVNLALTNPDEGRLTIGQPARFDIRIDGLGNQSTPSLGAFELDVIVNPAVLQFESESFEFGDQLQESIRNDPIDSEGTIRIAEVSLVPADVLNASQPGNFTLATLTFTPQNASDSTTLQINNVVLGDAFGESISVGPVDPVTITVTVDFLLQGMSPNVQSVANALGNACSQLLGRSGLTGGEADLQTTCSGLIQADPAEQEQTIQALAGGNVMAAQGTAAVGVANAQFTNVQLRLMELRGGALGFSVGGLEVNYGDLALSGEMLQQLFPNAQGGGASADEISAFGRLGAFINGSASFGDQDTTDRELGFDFDTYGVTAGVDYRFTDHIVAGLAGGYVSTDANYKGPGGNMDLHGYNVSLYGTYYHTDALYVDGIARAGWGDYDIRRRIRSPLVNATADGDTDSTEYAFSLGAGYDFNRNGFTFGPFGRLSYFRTKIDNFEEKNAGGNELAYDDQTIKSLSSALGGQVLYALSTSYGVFSPQVRFEWVHEFKDDSRTLDYFFVYDPTNTQIEAETDDPDRDTFNIGAGVSAVFGAGMTAFVYYENLLGYDDGTQHNITGGVRFEF